MRITSNKAHEKFAKMVEFAQDAGVDMEGWRFGTFYGSLYYLERPHSEYPDMHTEVKSFWTPREAWVYMDAMITAFAVVAKSNASRNVPGLSLVA